MAIIKRERRQLAHLRKAQEWHRRLASTYNGEEIGLLTAIFGYFAEGYHRWMTGDMLQEYARISR